MSDETPGHEELTELYQKICEVTTKYTFMHPVEDTDCETVLAELVAALPENGKGFRVGVSPNARRDFVGITVYKGRSVIYQRMMRVAGRFV